MATKARAVKLDISKDDSVEVAIWKLLADRVGRTKTEVADELIAFGFDRGIVERKVHSLMLRKWFERVEKKSHGLTKYVLKKDTKMPKQEEVNAPEATKQTDVLANDPDFKKIPDEVLNTPVEGDGTPIVSQAVADALQASTMDHNLVPAEGVLTCIWKAMADLQPYTRDDVVTLLTAVGVGESTVKQKFTEATLKGWFIASHKEEGGKDVKYYTMQAHIEKPTDDKPYRPRGTYKKEAAAPAADLVDQMASSTPRETTTLKDVIGDQLAAAGVPELQAQLRTGLEQTGVLSALNNTDKHGGERTLPNKSIGESEVRIATNIRPVFAEQDISDVELAAWTHMAMWTKDTPAGLVSELVKQHFDETEAKAVVDHSTKYWGVEQKDDGVLLSIPTAISRTTVTKERIADFKTAFHKKWVEEILDRPTPTTNKEEDMAKNQNEAAPKAPRAPTKAAMAKMKKIEDAATVLLWNLVKENRGNEQQNVLDAFAKSEFTPEVREKVLADNNKYFDVTMMAEVNYIKSPFAGEHPDLTIEDIQQYKMNFDTVKPTEAATGAKFEPFDEEVVKSITGYDGCVRAMYLLLKDGKTHSRIELGNQLRVLGFTGPMIDSSYRHLLNKLIVSEAKIEEGLACWMSMGRDNEAPAPALKVIGEIDPMDGVDYCIYQIVKDGNARYMSDIINTLVETGISEARIRDRLLQLTGVQYNFLDMRNSDDGIRFVYVQGGAVPEKKGVIKPNEAITPLNPMDGFLYNLYRVLTVKGTGDFEALAHRFNGTGYDRNILKPLLDELIERGVLITQNEDKTYSLIEGYAIPKTPVAPNTLSFREGLDYCIFKLLEDGNWSTINNVVDGMALVGFDRSRANDRIVRHTDKDGMILVGRIGEFDTIRLADGAVEPAKEATKSEERRGGADERRAPEAPAEEAAAQPAAQPAGAPAPSGLHAYEPNASRPDMGGKIPAQEPLLEVKIKVAGVHMHLHNLIQLYLELTNLGFGGPGYLPQAARQGVLQSTHKIAGRVMSEQELHALASELGKMIPPGPWLSQQQPMQAVGGYGPESYGQRAARHQGEPGWAHTGAPRY